VAVSFEHSNEISCAIKSREFIDQLSDYQLATKSSAPGVGKLVY
jgi:hypothetical protein